MISPGLLVFCMAALTAAVAFTASLSPAYSKAAALEFSPSHQTALRCSLAHAASSAAALPRAEMVAPDHAKETGVLCLSAFCFFCPKWTPLTMGTHPTAPSQQWPSTEPAHSVTVSLLRHVDRNHEHAPRMSPSDNNYLCVAPVDSVQASEHSLLDQYEYSPCRCDRRCK